jgi:hypothetical protein
VLAFCAQTETPERFAGVPTVIPEAGGRAAMDFGHLRGGNVLAKLLGAAPRTSELTTPAWRSR